MILTLRTDNPQAEVGLYDGTQQITYKKWQAHRQLSETLHKTIEELLSEASIEWHNISGIVFYKGPGSFTGLRIGASVANALASSNKDIRVANPNGENWIEDGIAALQTETQILALPEYGSDPHITKPKK